MIITRQNNKPLNSSQHRTNTGLYDNRIGFWGTVFDVHPENHTVDVISDTGIKCYGIAVSCSEWVKEREDYISGRQNLPEVNSWVFILTPTFTMNSAFVLCSGLPYGEAFVNKFFCESEDKSSEDYQDYINIEKTVSNGGWTTEKRNDNGNVKIENKEKDISLEIDHKEEGSEFVKIKVFGTELTINNNENGISIDIGNDDIENPLNLNISGDATIQGKKTISVTAESDCTVNGKSNISVTADKECTVKGDNINVEAQKKISIKNNGASLFSILNGMLQILNTSLATAGSPANHIVAPQQFMAQSQQLSQLMQ